MFASTVLNYMDRTAITLVQREIREYFAITSLAEFGWILSAFFMSYALFQVPAGYLVDRWDLRWTYAGAVAWWSLAAMATAIAPSVGWLFACRALLGVGESFNWPCALKATARILPPKARGLGNGIFNSGAAVGAVLTPIAVNLLRERLGWRGTFFVIGSVGFGWVALWILMLRGPRSLMLAREATGEAGHQTQLGRWSQLSRTAGIAFAVVLIAAIASGLMAFQFGPTAIWVAIAIIMIAPLLVAGLLPRQSLGGLGWATSLHEIATLRRFWVLVVVSISINICWHFLINWIPTYFQEDRSLTATSAGYLTASTFLAADMGNLAGGMLSLVLASLGLSVVRSRITAMSLCVILILAGPALGMANDNITVVVLLCLMAAGTAGFMANYFAFTQDVSSRHIGLIAGYLGGLGNLFVGAYMPFAGALRHWTGSFIANFAIVGVAPIVGIAVLVLGWGKEETTDPAMTPEA
jgi:ACS family hexuronate transporter-like MFS transporter